jgi:hypothetical protein
MEANIKLRYSKGSIILVEHTFFFWAQEIQRAQTLDSWFTQAGKPFPL